MPQYQFKAINSEGKVSNGVSAAPSQEELARILGDQGLFLMESSLLGQTDAPETKKTAAPACKPGEHVSLRELTLFTEQLSIMVRTALPIMEALEILAAQNANPDFKAMLLEIARSVRHGQPLSYAFARYPKVFDEVYISLLSSGEAGGQLDVMLERIAAHLDFQWQLKQKVQSALVYPTVVVLTAVSVVAFLVVFVIPTFLEVFTQFNIVLPLSTRALIFGSDLVRRWWYLLLPGAAGLWWYFSKWLTDPAHTRVIHVLQLRLPVVGELTRNIVMTRILMTLGSLAESGVPILKSLELSKAAAGNLVFKELIDKITDNVREGRGLAPALARSPYIPPAVTSMIAIGEKTGTLPEVLRKVARFYESQTDTSIKKLFAMMEPIFIIGLGLMVGGIAVSVLLPMFDLAGGLQ